MKAPRHWRRLHDALLDVARAISNDEAGCCPDHLVPVVAAWTASAYDLGDMEMSVARHVDPAELAEARAEVARMCAMSLGERVEYIAARIPTAPRMLS